MIDLNFHHIGVAAQNIERDLIVFEALGYKKASQPFIDKTQKIRGLFVEADGGAPRLELLENIDDQGPLSSLLKRQIKFYHFAYETDNIEKDAANIISSMKAIMIAPITSATYFEKVCFMALRNQAIIELVQLRKG